MFETLPRPQRERRRPRSGWLLALLALAVGCAAPIRRVAPPRHLVLVVLDTLRADRMSVYGYERDTTPFLRAAASQLLRFARVKAPAPWTAPSHASIFTGLWPAQHRSQWGRIPLGEEQVTLAELLQAAGFSTCGLSANLVLSKRNGFHQGFDEFTIFRGNMAGKTPRIMAALPAVLDGARESGRRLFLFVNLMDTHIPYRAKHYGESYGLIGQQPITNAAAKWQVSAGERSLSEEQWQMHRAAYDAAVRYLDDVVADLFALLEQREMLEQTVVVLTSDHGDGLGLHPEIGHSISVWEEQLAVPLLIRLPQARRGGEVVTRRTSLTGLTPFLLDTLQVPRPEHLRQAPGLEPAAGHHLPVLADYRSYFSEANRAVNLETAERYPELAAQVSHRHVLYCGHLKLIVAPPERISWFGLAADPHEQHEMVSPPPGSAACLERYRQLLSRGLLTDFSLSPRAPAGEAELKALKEMGYVQ